MACQRTAVVWMAVVAVAAVLVVENESLCMAVDVSGAEESVANTAEEAKNGAESWSSWVFNKVSGKLSVQPQDMKQGAEDMMHEANEKATEAKEFAEGKVHSVSRESTGITDGATKLFDEAKNGVGAAYDSVASKTTH